MPYDKDGKYYRQPTNSVNKNKKSSSTSSKKTKPIPSVKSLNQQRNLGTLILAIFLVGIVG